MLRTRVIPCLQLVDYSLVKTIKFGKFNYIGDPVNTVRIFNELEVDELCFLDIRASVENQEPNFDVLRQIKMNASCHCLTEAAYVLLKQRRKYFSRGSKKLC